MNSIHRLIAETSASGRSGRQIIAALYNNAAFVLHRRDCLEALLQSSDPSAPASSLSLFREPRSLAEMDDTASAGCFSICHTRPLRIRTFDVPSFSNIGNDSQDSAVVLYNMGVWHCQTASAVGLSREDRLASLNCAAQLLCMALDISPMPAQAKDDDMMADYISIMLMRNGIDTSSKSHDGEVSTLALNALGIILLQLGRPEEALRYLSKAYTHIASPSTTSSNELMMVTLSNLSHVHHALNQHELASDACVALLAMLEEQEASLLAKEGKAVVLHNLATSFHHSGKLDRALQTYEALLDYVRSVPTDNEDTNKTAKEILRFIEIDALRRTGLVWSDCGQPDEAARALLESVRVQTSYSGMSDLPFLASTMLDLGHALLSSGHVGKSIEAFKRACAMARHVYGPEHINVTKALYSLGRLHEITGDVLASLQCYSEALYGVQRRLAGLSWWVKRTERNKRDDSMLLVKLLRTVGSVYMEAGNVTRAAMVLKEARMVERGLALDNNDSGALVEEESTNNSRLESTFQYSDIHKEIEIMLGWVDTAPAA